MRNQKTTILIFCLLAGACLAGTGQWAFADRVTEPKAPVETPAVEEAVSPEWEALSPTEAVEAGRLNTEESAASPNDYEGADTPLSSDAEDAARAARMRQARPFLIGFGIVSVLLLVFTILLDRVPGFAAGLAGIMKLEIPERKGPPRNMVRSLQQLEEWKMSGMISEGEYLRLKRQYSAAHRGRRGEGR